MLFRTDFCFVFLFVSIICSSAYVIYEVESEKKNGLKKEENRVMVGGDNRSFRSAIFFCMA